MSKASKELLRRMAEKVDVDKLWMVEHPNLHEKLVLELSRELEKQKDADYVSVSWASQVEAADYFNKHGFVDTLTHMLSLRDKFEKENNMSISKQSNPPPIGSIVYLKGYAHRAMVVADSMTDANNRLYAVSVVWLDHVDHPCGAVYPIECLDLGE